MKNVQLVALGLIACLLLASSCYDHDAQVPDNLWVKINTPHLDKIFAFQFINVDTGYILGAYYKDDGIYNILIKTFDGGQTWETINYTPQFLRDTSKGLMQSIYVSPFNPNIIFSGAGNLLRSINGGLHWQKVDTINHKGSTLMHFFDPLNGVSVGGENASVTIDSGYNWSQTFFQSSFGFIDLLQFTSKKMGYFAGGFQFDGGAGGILGKTTDGGNTWQVIDYPFDDIVSVSFANDNIGYVSMITATGNIGVTYLGSKFIKTTDGGSTWQEIYSGSDTQYAYTDVYFITELEGYVMTPKGVYHTIDGCKTWQQESTITVSLSCFPNKHTNYIIDVDGKLYKRQLQ